MREVQFIRSDWLEFAASLYPEKVLVYSHAMQVPDLPDAGRERVFIPYCPKPQTMTNSVVQRKSA